MLGVALFLGMMTPISILPRFAEDRMSASEGDGAHRVAPIDPDDCLPKYPPPPVVKISVRVPACSDPGTAIKYRICVENCSTAEAHHVVVKNALPANAKFVKADPAPTKQGPELQWNLGTIGGGGVREIILVLQPTNKDDVKNCARVQFEHGQCVVTRQTALPGAKPPIISTVPEVPAPGDRPILDIQVFGLRKQFVNLDTVYDIIITNKGKTRATNTEARALVSEKLIVKKVSAPGVDAKNLVEWKLGILEPGASQRLQITLRPTEAGKHCFKVAAEADHGVKKEVEHCTEFGGVSALGIDMAESEDPVFVGNQTTFAVLIRSQGSAALTNIRLRAIVPKGLKLDRATPPMFVKRENVKDGELIEFAVLPKIDVGEQARYEITVAAGQAGYTRFHIDVNCDQLTAGPVVVQEGTTIVDGRGKVNVQKLNRPRNSVAGQLR